METAKWGPGTGRWRVWTAKATESLQITAMPPQGASPRRAAWSEGTLPRPPAWPPTHPTPRLPHPTPTPPLPSPAAPLTGSPVWVPGSPQCSPQRTQAASGASSLAPGCLGGGRGAVGIARDTGSREQPFGTTASAPRWTQEELPTPFQSWLFWKPASAGSIRKPTPASLCGV